MEDLLYKLNKSKDDVEILLTQHKNLIYHMLGLTGQTRNPDAESASWEALWDAVHLFDIYGKTQFSTFACTLIRNAIYDTLREQNKLLVEVQIDEDFAAEIVSMDQNPIEIIGHIETLFKEYISDKIGLTKDALLIWYSSSFEAKPTDIAKQCSCSTSTVSRIQQSFRSFLSGKLREL